MDNAALKRLRLGFALLGVLLLTPLYFVLRTAEARLEAQRRLRHEIVAARIFDEMERELTTLLENERSRPSSAYDAANTRVSGWSPFVVGYFTGDRADMRLLGQEQLASARARRVNGALTALWQSDQAPLLAGADATDRPADPLEASEKNAAQTLPRPAPQQEEVLRQLNRARKRESYPSKQRADQYRDDPLMGL